MCGIYGVIGEIDTESFEAAGNLMRHRGPDASGDFHLDNIHLGHRRLSILDLNERANQPMIDSSKRVVLVYNGEIYNYQSLRNLTDYNYQTTSDTEVIIGLYLKYGIKKTVELLRGMFAFALLDTVKNKLYLVRDHVGKKPLYYGNVEGRFIFSSTLNSFKALLRENTKINHHSVQHYFIRSYIPSPCTIYDDIKKLEPATCLEFNISAKTYSTYKFWKPDASRNVISLNENEHLDNVSQLLIESVKKRLVSDVPVGVFLSGGIDSSLVASILSKELNINLNTYTVRFFEEQYNEADTAQKIADELGVGHEEVPIESFSLDTVAKVVGHYGEPFGDHSAIPTYLLSGFAKGDISVALTGDGGDESFAGYNSHLALHISEKFSALYGVSGLKNLLYSTGAINKGLKWVNTLNKKRGGWFGYDPMGDKGFRNNFNLLFNEGNIEDIDQIEKEVWEENLNISWLSRGQLIGYNKTLPDGLLTKSDVSTMAHSLEARSPLLDVDLINYALTIPDALKLKNYKTKYILRKLLSRYLPQNITNLPKRGFSLPLSKFLKSNEPAIREMIYYADFSKIDNINADFIRKYIDDYYKHNKGKANHVWLFLIFFIWLNDLE